MKDCGDWLIMEVAVRPSRGIRHALDLMAAKSVVFFNFRLICNYLKFSDMIFLIFQIEITF